MPRALIVIDRASHARSAFVAAATFLALVVAAPASQARELGVRDIASSGRVVMEGGEVGRSIAAVGDVDGDGAADLAIAGPEPAGDERAPLVAATVLLSGGRSFTIGAGVEGTDRSGRASVAAAGDVNGDGLADLVLTDPRAGTTTMRLGENSQASIDGSAFVVFGDRAPADVALDRLGARGFVLRGIGEAPAAGAGDVNGDGIGDLIVGTELGEDGRAYVVFGGRSSPAVRDVFRLGAGGFRIEGKPGDLTLGATVAGPGDVDGDGLADVLVAAPNSVGRAVPVDVREPFGPGAAYVVFGARGAAATSTVRVGRPAGRALRIGPDGFGFWGVGLAGGGDVNGDGRADVVLGAPLRPFLTAGPGGARGAAAVVFGSAERRDVAIKGLGAAGLRIDGTRTGAGLGSAVAPAGDLDGDGLDDVLLGEAGLDDPRAEPGLGGRVLVAYGRREGGVPELLELRGRGAEHAGAAVTAGSDLDRDGRPELAVLVAVTCRAGRVETPRVVSLELGEPPVPPQPGTGGPGPDAIDGGAGSDELSGLAGGDGLRGLGGDDCLYGGPGDDRVRGGDGRDALFGEEGDDVLIAGDGRDILNGGEGADALDGGAGNDLLSGDATDYEDDGLEDARSGNDRLRGGAGDDELRGAAGRDRLEGGTGDDQADGGAGADRVLGGVGADVVEGAAGDDVLDGGSGRDTLLGGPDADRVVGGAGADDLAGGSGRDVIEGGPGDDVLRGDGSFPGEEGVDPDRLLGGSGDDRILARDGRRDTIDCGPGRDTATVDRRDRVRNCERVRRPVARRR